MWFLGAGASATSGIPTAWDMIWDFKRTLYCTEQKVSVRACPDLHDSALQKRIQQFCDVLGTFPSLGSEQEYAEYFQAVHPSESDRRRYIETMIQRGRPTYGHLALATLMLRNRVRVVWTTNFDRNIEDAAAKLFQTTSKLGVATLDSPQIASDSFQEGRWPLLTKLHGDFSSRKLKNTTHELITQDERLRSVLCDACQRSGLIVVGYSGRDDSIMAALEESVRIKGSFPQGLFWVVRPDTKFFPRVGALIEKAAKNGIDAAIVDSNSFDELMADLLLLEPELPPDIAKLVDVERPRVSDAPMPGTKGTWPAIRFNALPIRSFPTNCRKLSCKLGGAKQVREAVERAGRTILAARRRTGVLAFGRDEDVRATFADFEPSGFDLHSIEARRLEFDSAELGLLYDAVTCAIARERHLLARRRHHAHLLAIDPRLSDDAQFGILRRAVRGSVSGDLPGGIGWWSDGIILRLERRDNRLWLLFEPTTWVGDLAKNADYEAVKEFQRQRSASRYNDRWSVLLDAWSEIISGGAKTATLSAFGITEGVDAVFEIGSRTAFSWRLERR
jgi:NAD-dependent SIR2 family protein deacetylase